MTPAQLLSAPLQISQISLGAPLPPALSQWLTQHQPHPLFATPGWFTHLAGFLQQRTEGHKDSTFYWLIVSVADSIVLAAPLEEHSSLGYARLRLLSNFYSPMLELFFDNAGLSAELAWQTLLRALTQLRPGWLSLRLTPLTELQLQCIRSSAAQQQCSAFSYQFSANYRADCSNPQLYWQQRPSQLRNTLQRKARQLQKYPHRFELTAHPAQLQIDHYWQIYQHSWKHPEPSKDFINWLFQWAATEGKLRLGLLYIEEQVVACQLWLVHNGTACIFKLAQDINANRFSPGSLLSEYMINQLAQQDQIHSLDFLLGDDDFKALWMDQKQQIYGMELLNRQCLSGRLLGQLQQLKQRIKHTFSVGGHRD
ncbi:GNAT family N-acetyltransferase [Rheinheimera sp. NSM]|uniref:GNAT family N-acetyltransferase n=1 Tax=Rheinheimera sp. NSM TaxID=3457884 RepID=UPI004035CF35